MTTPVIVYHGTNFTNDAKKLTLTHPAIAHIHGQQLGFGIYVATNRELANSYGKYLIKIQYPFAKPVNDQKRELSKSQIKNLLKYQQRHNEILSNYGDISSTSINELYEDAYRSLNYNLNDLDLVNELANIAGTPIDVANWLVKNGYNYAAGQQGQYKIYVLYDPSKFKQL